MKNRDNAPFLRINGALNRLSVLAMFVITFALAGTNPALALFGLIAANALFALTDGIGGVPWIDMVAKTIPGNRRGTLFGVMHTLTAPFTFLPMLGGLLIQFLNHEILFSATLGFILAGNLLAASLPEPRKVAVKKVARAIQA